MLMRKDDAGFERLKLYPRHETAARYRLAVKRLVRRIPRKRLELRIDRRRAFDAERRLLDAAARGAGQGGGDRDA